MLDGLMTGVLALVAGADGARAVLLGLAMVSLQVSIGALNDLVDVENDRGRKPGKPIPAGLVSPAEARIVVVAALALGLVLSTLAGPAALVVALAGVAAGFAYDLRLKATAWAWLPFAIGLPLLPVYVWVGATGRVPAPFGLLVPLAVLAGAAVALLNGLVDVERDRSAGVATPAVRLGPGWTLVVAGCLMAIVAGGAVVSLAWIAADSLAWLVSLVGLGLIGLGLVLAGSAVAARREQGWEASVIGLGLLAAGWALGFVEAGLL